jgi:hypothetical protein
MQHWMMERLHRGMQQEKIKKTGWQNTNTLLARLGKSHWGEEEEN